MADVVTLVETVGSTVAATAAIFGALWKPVIRRHDERSADDLFLHGRVALPGIPAVSPAGERLGNVETTVGRIETTVNIVRDEVTTTGNAGLKGTVLGHIRVDEERWQAIESFMGTQVAEQKRVAQQLDMRTPVIDRIASEQTRVAHQLEEREASDKEDRSE